jgi:hypothetical protein
MNFCEILLKDPVSAQYRFSEPRKGLLKPWSGGKFYGYLVLTAINAKNSYGGYTGFKNAMFVIRNGQVVQYSIDGPDNAPVTVLMKYWLDVPD